MSIRIVLPEGKAPRLSRGTKIYTETGEEIKGVTRISLDLDRDRVMTATIEVIVDDIENFDVEGVVVVKPKLDGTDD
jgi:hypothetical protein